MSKGKTNGAESPLTAAAAALEGELHKYAELSEAIARAPLNSEKAIDRVVKSVADAVESEKQVMLAVKSLLEAIHGARALQERCSSTINDRGATIAQKRTELELLLTRFRNIGTVAKGLNEAMQKVAGYKPDPYDAEGASAIKETLAKIESGMGECANHAEEVATDATSRDFPDVARQADGLRQQLLSTKNRLALLQKQLDK